MRQECSRDMRSPTTSRLPPRIDQGLGRGSPGPDTADQRVVPSPRFHGAGRISEHRRRAAGTDCEPATKFRALRLRGPQVGTPHFCLDRASPSAFLSIRSRAMTGSSPTAWCGSRRARSGDSATPRFHPEVSRAIRFSGLSMVSPDESRFDRGTPEAGPRR